MNLWQSGLLKKLNVKTAKNFFTQTFDWGINGKKEEVRKAA